MSTQTFYLVFIIRFLSIILIQSFMILPSSKLPLHSKRFSLLMSNLEKQLWLESTGDFNKDLAFLQQYTIDTVFQKESLQSDSLSYHQKDSFDKLWNKVICTVNGKLINENKKVIGSFIEIDSTVDGQNRALPLVGSVEWIVLMCTGSWTMIPCENLIAACDGACTKLAVYVDSVDKLAGVLFSLELGPVAVILAPDKTLFNAYMDLTQKLSTDTADTNSNENGIKNKNKENNSNMVTSLLQEATVTKIQNGGVGDRVCLDLIQTMSEGEGLLLGSSSQMLTLIHAETKTSEFVPARPFRVNAGPVHSYVLMADWSTKYLCEVQAGDAVKVVKVKSINYPTSMQGTSNTYDKDSSSSSSSGDNNIIHSSSNNRYSGNVNDQSMLRTYTYTYSERSVTVGRCKTESRPTYMVEFACCVDSTTIDRGSSGTDKSAEVNTIKSTAAAAVAVNYEKGQIFLQQAETVRLVTPPLLSHPSTSYTVTDTETTTINTVNQQQQLYETIPVTELRVGDRVLVLRSSLGTHVGRRISARVNER